MRVRFTERLRKSYKIAPLPVREAFDKQVQFLARDLHYPPLRAKKYYDETRGLWQARATGQWRFYFVIEGDAYVIVGLTPHPK